MKRLIVNLRGDLLYEIERMFPKPRIKINISKKKKGSESETAFSLKYDMEEVAIVI
jgi:hypothetical protein